MWMVKLVIIRMWTAQQNFGSSFFSSHEALSLHFSFKLGVTITLLSCFARNSSLENTIFCNILFFVVAIATMDLYYVGCKDLRAIFRPNIFFVKENDTNWWGSPGRYGTLAILNVSVIPAQLRTYAAEFYYSNLVWERDHTKVECKLCLNFGEWSGNGRTSWTGSGAYE